MKANHITVFEDTQCRWHPFLVHPQQKKHHVRRRVSHQRLVILNRIAVALKHQSQLRWQIDREAELFGGLLLQIVQVGRHNAPAVRAIHVPYLDRLLWLEKVEN